ncbi:tripartite tricarboxylate transporter substrate binding protein [Vibrio pectenicida]|uniref:Tripartite tricarboxylate transporter substrate binding protein n=1 Tax=Vibrio pectenicida TaxID=62763 RepID=A0A3R9EIW7_9VIBR|nr:tripartite tricarboxylate transporter substrate-binding protein [Vibrio pectenicida]RSD31446.1 tripartite tricarboxylate transporter substrate binding protein [Vibrio pectenicida]
MFKKLKLPLIAFIIAGPLTSQSIAADIDKLHFLIPGWAGGGWDMTARGIGDVLVKEEIVDQVSFQNLSGGGGGKAISHLIETAKRQPNTLMVNSTPIVVRSLNGIFPQSFRDLTPVAATIADYGAIVTSANSQYTSWVDVVKDFIDNPRKIKIAGGSARGSMDHLVIAAAFKNEGFDPRKVRYISYNAGAKATAALLSGETTLLSTGLGEVLELSKSGQVKILAITAPKRLEVAPDTPTLTEYGNNTIFANWRGFFAAPGTSQEQVDKWNHALQKMYKTDEWQKIKSRNGWIDNYKADKDFYTFLEGQEKQIGRLMSELGFLK